MSRINIAFHFMGGIDWTVGAIYLKNLFYALRKTYGKKVGLYLLAQKKEQCTEEYTSFIRVNDVILYKKPRRWTPIWVLNGLNRRLLSHNLALERVLIRHKVNIVFGPTLAFKFSKIPTLSWFPDMQHILLPEMFCDTERHYRNQTFLQCAKLATRIILMSDVVRKDFKSFAPMYKHKVRVLHPVSYISQSIYNYDLNSVLQLYHIPKKFIYLPNQFWKHKNHELTFQAVKILKNRGIKVFIVCTGSPSDYRHPSYFANLFLKLSQWNIRDRVAYLGLIPHKQVLLLMRQSICVLNPSLFEGWGFTVNEARSVGKQVLLTDIPAHREQNPPKAIFFDPKNSDDLTMKLREIWLNASSGPDMELERKARETQPERIRRYAESFMSIVQEVIK